MKPGLFIALILLLLPGRLEAQQDRFEEANQLLEEHQTDAAMELYRSIEEEGYQSGMLFYNMGIASVSRDSLGLAKYYFLHATDFKDAQEEALQALNYLNNQFERRSAILPPLPWERFFIHLGNRYGGALLALFGLLLLNLAAGLLITAWFKPEPSRWLRRSSAITALIAILALLSATRVQYLDNRYKTGVMVHPETTLYHEPDRESTAVTTVYEGYTLRVDLHESETAESWARVRLQNGMTGWIKQDLIRYD
ncbi:MAG: SH3 domain-containing protein [Balneolaceae bacterium]